MLASSKIPTLKDGHNIFVFHQATQRQRGRERERGKGCCRSYICRKAFTFSNCRRKKKIKRLRGRPFQIQNLEDGVGAKMKGVLGEDGKMVASLLASSQSHSFLDGFGGKA